jgi:hypothetical protein
LQHKLQHKYQVLDHVPAHSLKFLFFLDIVSLLLHQIPLLHVDTYWFKVNLGAFIKNAILRLEGRNVCISWFNLSALSSKFGCKKVTGTRFHVGDRDREREILLLRRFQQPKR